MRLENRVAVVTGAGTGLGRAIALAMSEAGAKLVLIGRRREKLEAVADAAETESRVCPTDIAVPAEVARMAAQAQERFSRVDILVNNAAIIGPASFLQDTSPETWKQTLDINLYGAFLCTHALVPAMIEQKRGKIISITSGLGQRPFPRFCAYGVSKAGINQLTRNLAEELAPYNIQVNAIDPGVMDTPMQTEIRDRGPQLLSQPIHRRFSAFKNHGELKPPQEVAPLAVYLGSSDSDKLTGRIGTVSEYRRMGWKR